MINNEKFNLATGGNTYNVVPLVIIVSNSGLVANYFSTQPTNIGLAAFDPLSFDPLLLNVSSIKESVDVETRKYKTSSVTITLSNAKYLGRRLSDSYTDIINGDVEIYFKTQNITDLTRAILVYKGTVRRISQTDTTLTLSVEDASEQKVHKDIPESITNETDFKSKFKNKPFPMVIGKVDRSPCITSFGTTGEYDIDDDGDLDEYDFVREVFADRKELAKLIPENLKVGNNKIGVTSLYAEVDDDYVGIYPTTQIDFESGLGEGFLNYSTLVTNNGFTFLNLFNEEPEDENEDDKITIEELAKNDTAANRGRVLVERKENKIERVIQTKGLDSNFIFKSGIVQGDEFIEDSNLNFNRINDGNPNSCVQIEGDYKMQERITNGFKYLDYSFAYLKFHFDSLPSGVTVNINDASTWSRYIAKIQILDKTLHNIPFDNPDMPLQMPLVSVFTQENNFGGQLDAKPFAVIEPKSTLIHHDHTRMNVVEDIVYNDDDFPVPAKVIKPPEDENSQEDGRLHIFATSQSEYNSYDGNSPLGRIHPILVPNESNFYCLGLPKIAREGLYREEDDNGNVTLHYPNIDIPAKIRIFESSMWAMGTLDNLLQKNFYANVWGRPTGNLGIYNLQLVPDIGQSTNEIEEKATGQLLKYLFDNNPFVVIDANTIYNILKDNLQVYPTQIIVEEQVSTDPNNPFGGVTIDITDWQIVRTINSNEISLQFRCDGIVTSYSNEEEEGSEPTIPNGDVKVVLSDGQEYTLQSEYSGYYEFATFDIIPIEKAGEIVKHILEEECKYDGEFNENELNAIEQIHSGWNFAFTQNKLISSKKLIEDFSRSTKSFPRFRADGTFGWNVVKDTYSDDDIDLIVDESDIINYRYDRTKLEDVKTKVKVLFNIDYAKGNHLFSTDDILATDYVNTSIYQYYGLATDDSDSTLNFETDYIRDRYTAEQLRNWLLTWNMNQKNLISLTLPIKYIKLEVGDVVALDKEIQGTKIFGETYTQTSITRNGQEIYPYFMVYETNKNLEKIDIKLIQLHNLDINSLGTVEEQEAQQEESNVVLPTGDVNGDGNTDVVDIVNVISFVLGAKQPTDEEFFQADINQDGNVDVLDIVALVNIILG